MRRIPSVGTVIAAVLLISFSPVAAVQEEERSLFERVAAVLQRSYYDEEYRAAELPGLVERFRPRAASAETLRAQRELTHEFLSHIPVSHLGLLSKSSHQRLLAEIFNQEWPMVGFELLELDGKHFVHNLYEGGPGERAGLLRGDRIVAIDGQPAGESPRLDWRTDDSHLPDPPLRAVLVEEDEAVQFTVERREGERLELEVTAALYNSFAAAKASARVHEVEGKRIGYLHFWYIHMSGVPGLVREKLEGPFADCDAFVLDLRGRGGAGHVIPQLLAVFEGPKAAWDRPLVALIDRHSRSAKDTIAYEFRERDLARLVGEETAGAVIPATFAEVGHDTVLMYPSFVFGDYTAILEGDGVDPHVAVAGPGPYAAGADPILEAGLREAVRLAGE